MVEVDEEGKEMELLAEDLSKPENRELSEEVEGGLAGVLLAAVVPNPANVNGVGEGV